MRIQFSSKSNGEVFKASEFKMWMDFVRAYNEIKSKYNLTNETEIFARMKEVNASYENAVLNAKFAKAIKQRFQSDRMPNKDEESLMVSEYENYMIDTYREKEDAVKKAREDYNKKKYQTANGSMSAKEFLAEGKKAKKFSRTNTIVKVLSIGAGILLGAGLLGPFLVSALTPVIPALAGGAVSAGTLFFAESLVTLASAAIGGTLGWAAQGPLVELIFPGLKSKRKTNKSFLERFNENLMDLGLDEQRLREAEAELSQVTSDFAIHTNEYGSVESEIVEDFKKEYPLTSEVVEEETAEADSDSAEAFGVFDAAQEENEEPQQPEELQQEVVVEQPAPQSEAENTSDPEVVVVIEEASENNQEEESKKGDDSVKEEPSKQEESTSVEPAPQTVDVVDELHDPIDEAQRKKAISKLRGYATRRINASECSMVGRYELISLRESINGRIERCQNAGDVQSVIEEIKSEFAEIEADYKKYVASTNKNTKSKKSTMHLHERSAEEKGSLADKHTRDDGASQVELDKTFYGSLYRSYTAQFSKMQEKYLDIIGATDEVKKAKGRELAEQISVVFKETFQEGKIDLGKAEERLDAIRIALEDEIGKNTKAQDYVPSEPRQSETKEPEVKESLAEEVPTPKTAVDESSVITYEAWNQMTDAQKRKYAEEHPNYRIKVEPRSRAKNNQQAVGAQEPGKTAERIEISIEEWRKKTKEEQAAFAAAHPGFAIKISPRNNEDAQEL